MAKKRSNGKWTKKQLKFMQMLADPLLDKSDEDIAVELNVKPETLSRWRRLPGFQRMAKKLAEEYLGNGCPAVLKELSKKAKEGNVQAIKLFMDYTERYGEGSQKEPDTGEEFDIETLTEEERKKLQQAIINRLTSLKRSSENGGEQKEDSDK